MSMSVKKVYITAVHTQTVRIPLEATTVLVFMATMEMALTAVGFKFCL